MDALMAIVFGAILVEAITGAVKLVYDPEKRTISWGVVTSLVVGLGVAFASGMDLCAAAGVPLHVPYVPQIITGILISRGANYVYDILAQIKDSVAKSE
jgi:hypothetical protein